MGQPIYTMLDLTCKPAVQTNKHKKSYVKLCCCCICGALFAHTATLQLSSLQTDVGKVIRQIDFHIKCTLDPLKDNFRSLFTAEHVPHETYGHVNPSSAFYSYQK